MNNPESIAIINRFYEALDTLIANKTLRGVQTFTRRYDINRRNFLTVKAKPQSNMFKLVWINYLVNDYNVSLEYIMKGAGGMFRTPQKRTLLDIQSYIGKKCLIKWVNSKKEEKTSEGLVEELKRDYRKKTNVLIFQQENRTTKNRIPVEEIKSIKIAE